MDHTLLLVDDDKNVLSSLRRLFRKEPYIILTAVSAHAALDMLKTNNVHLIISDQDMPEMTGTDFFTRIWATHPEIVRFMLTGKASLSVAMDAINHSHVNKIFTKPWNNAELLQETRQSLEMAHALSEGWENYQKRQANRLLIEEFNQKFSANLCTLQIDEEGDLIIDDPSLLKNSAFLQDMKSLLNKMR